MHGTKWLLVSLLAAFCFWFPAAFKRWTHAFRPQKCLVEWPFNPAWEFPPLSREKKAEITAVLNGPFSYLAKGAQSYVFLSRDQKYVLKLFRFDTCKVPFGQKAMRAFRKWAGMREKYFLSTSLRAPKIFNSCQWACSLAPSQTGVVFAHLNPKSADLPVVTLKDRLGRSHQIDPAKYRFVLQKKAEPFGVLRSKEEIQPYIDSYFTLLDEIGNLGLVNLDTKLGGNFGFIDGKAAMIDFGNIHLLPEQAADRTAIFSLLLETWLKKNGLFSKAKLREDRG